MTCRSRRHDGFQSTLPARGSDGCVKSYNRDRQVSIHAPREGERLFKPCFGKGVAGVSIHAPREGERQDYTKLVGREYAVSIHAPREGERLRRQRPMLGHDFVSIHAPREGERRKSSIGRTPAPEFQSTLPARGSDP